MWEYSDKVKEHFTNPKNVGSIENADAMAILGNAPYFGTRVFIDKEEAERELAKKRAEEAELMVKRGKELPPSYEGYRECWEDECEEDDDE